MSTTFLASNVAIEKPKNGSELRNIGSGSFRRELPVNSINYTPCNNSFICSLLFAYNQHIPLVLRPDEIWITILCGVAHYVDAHAEELRDKFVSHEGKKDLFVELGTTYLEGIDEKLWAYCFETMCNLIRANTKKDLVDWVTCNFSTSTKLDVTVSHLMLMGAMKNYFSYSCGTECAMTQVTMLGHLDDWKLLRIKCEFLTTFGIKDFDFWARDLLIVIDKFIESYIASTEGKSVDMDWWNTPFSQQTYGSGATTYIRGWAAVFAPFSRRGGYNLSKRGIKENCVDVVCIPSTAFEIPITFIPDGAPEIECMITAGVLSATYDSKKNQVSSGNGWFINKQVPKK